MLSALIPPPRPRAKTPLPILPVTIIGMDLSLTSTGIAVYARGRITTLRLRSKHSGLERLLDLRAQLGAFLYTHKPGLIGIEGYSFGSKNSRAHSIGEWGGVAKLTVSECRSAPTGYLVSPVTLKKFMTGNHQAKKPEVVLHLFKRYGIEVPQEDEADAACISILIGAHRYADQFPSLTDFQRKALAGVENLS